MIIVTSSLVMIECGGGGKLIVILLCRAESRPVDGSYCINGSVFSEALDALVTIVMDLTALSGSVF